MPSRKIVEKLTRANTLGQQRKVNSDYIMEATWDGDIASRTVYLFDMYHDPDPSLLNDIPIDAGFVPLEIKYIKHTSQTLAKDYVSFHLQMKPSQEKNVPYYDMYERMYNMEFPIGLYVAIPDKKGIHNKWMIVGRADGDNAQFATYEILRCDFVLQYVMENKKHFVSAVLRSQNS